jgi:hypothetical protein
MGGPYPPSPEEPVASPVPLLLPPDDELPLLDDEDDDAAWSGPPASSVPLMPVLEHAPCRPAAAATAAAHARTDEARRRFMLVPQAWSMRCSRRDATISRRSSAA